MAVREKRLIKKPTPLRSHLRPTVEGCLTGQLDKDIELLRAEVRDAGDLQLRLIYTQGKRQAAIFYFENMVDVALVGQNVIRPLQEYEHELDPKHLAQAILSIPGQRTETELKRVAASLSEGHVVLLLDGYTECLSLSVAQIPHRPIARSESEDVLLGPHDSFSEALGPNLAMLRKRVASPALKYKILKIGAISQTPVAIIFIDNVVKEELVQEVEERLRRIDIDYLYGRSLIDLICDEPSALLPLIRTTERPGRVVAALMEGRVAIQADGDPGVMIVPSFAPEYLQSSEDYYERPVVATFLRFVRFLGLIIAVFMPGLWIALVSFHHGVIPPPLFASIQTSREGVPLPTIIEMFILLLAFDIIVEASTRMPSRIGQALGIVGGIILGQAAVQAGLVSPAMVIVVSLTGLAIFTQPSPSSLGPLRLIKYPILVASSFLGLFGTVWSLIFIVMQVVSMRSFGYPYMYPVAPFNPRGELDIFIRVPLFWLNKRPSILTKNVRRMNATPPRPGKEKEDES